MMALRRNAVQLPMTTGAGIETRPRPSGGTPGKLLRHIVFPAALPSIFSGLRISIGSAWMLTVTAEMVAVKSGVGYVLWDSYYFLRYDLVIASMVSIGLLGFLSDLAIKLFAGRVLRWQRGSTLQAKEA